MYARPKNARDAGFTLIELLVVIGVLAVLATVIIAGLRGADKTVSVRAAQATMANALNAARNRAVTRGVNVAVLVHNDPSVPERYRRTIALVENVTTSPVAVAFFELPKGTGVVPHSSRFATALRDTGNWNGLNSNNLMTSSWLNSTISFALNGSENEAWEYRNFSPSGTTTAGTVVISSVRVQAAGSYPIIFEAPDLVRGFRVSTYGLPRMVDDRSGF